ncbi:MAG: DUF2652 domain-containing protein [Bacteroidota bacterium]
MKSKTQRVVLLIADISGYTKFITRTKMSLAHAQAIITELMKSIITEIDIPLRIVEVEGDALFVYGAEGKDEYNWEEVISFISEKIFLFFQLFHKRLHELIHSNMCHCGACDGADHLKLKVIVHIGEVLFHKIDRFSRLSGPDVILTHKLLKNSVDSDQYMVMTEMTYAELSKYKHFEVEKRVEEYEHIGKVNLYVHYPNTVHFAPESLENKYSEVSIYRKLRQTLQIVMNGMLMNLGLKSVPKFHHLSKL